MRRRDPPGPWRTAPRRGAQRGVPSRTRRRGRPLRPLAPGVILRPIMRRLLILLALLAAPAGGGEVTVFPARGPEAARLTIYSALDLDLARPIVEGFQASRPGVTILYEDMLTGEIFDRVVRETEAGGPTADFVFSSAMDLQVKLANDGYARRVAPPEAEVWPRWAGWRSAVWALTFEPAVFVYNRDTFGDAPPVTRDALVRWLAAHPEAAKGRIGTYDIARAGAGFLFLARDQEHFADIWRVIRALGQAGAQTFPNSSDILERVADGRLVFGYNILGSYAALWARSHPQVGVALPQDYTVVIARTGLVPRAAAAPELGEAFLGYLMSHEGQEMMAQELDLPAVHPEVMGDETAGSLLARFGTRLRPVPLGPGLLVYLDQAKRARLSRDWQRALSGAAAD